MLRNINSAHISMKRYFYIITVLAGVVTYVWFSLLVALIVIFVLCIIALVISDDEQPSTNKYTTSSSRYGRNYQGNQYKANRVAEVARQFIDRAIAEKNGFVNSNDLMPVFGVKVHSDKTLYKADLDNVICELRRLGYGIVPNYEFGHRRLDFNEQCVLYKSHNNSLETVPPLVRQGELFVKLFSIVLNGKRIIPNDIEYIGRCIGELNIPEKYHNYLKAYILWLQLKKQPYDKRTKDEVSALHETIKSRFVTLLLEAVSTNGNIDNDRLEALKKILPTLDVDPASVHSLLHQSIINAGLATIEQAEGVSEYVIRQPDEMKPAPKETSTIVLDERKLGDLKKQTQEAQEMLSDIFIEEEETHIPDNNNTNNAVVEALNKLLERDAWQRAEVQELFGANVMLGNMLEQINDYAYSKVDDIVVEEDGDTIYVTTEYKEQLI